MTARANGPWKRTSKCHQVSARITIIRKIETARYGKILPMTISPRRSDVTITVCPYFQPLDAGIAGRYAEAGADAVAALLIPFGPDDVRRALDDLQPVIDLAASS